MLLKKLTKLLKKLDIFGAPLSLQINSDGDVYRSVGGGVITMLIYILALVYSIQLGYQWLNWEILPTVNMQTYQTEMSELLELKSTLFSLSFVNQGFSTQEIKQINQSEQYLYDYAISYRSSNESRFQKYDGLNRCRRPKEGKYIFATICQNISDSYQNHLYSPDNISYGTYLYYGTKYCDQKDPLCFSKDIMKQYAARGGVYWELMLYREEVDLSNGRIFQVIQPYFLQFDNDTAQFTNIQLKVTKAKVSIDNGFFFSDPKTFTIIKDVQPLITPDKSYIPDQGPSISVSTNNYYVQIIITFPSITIILSQILSFFQTIGLLGYVAVFYNSYRLQNFTSQTLLDIYFPQFKCLKQNKIYESKNQSILKATKTLDQNIIPKFFEQREKINRILMRKSNLFVLIQEINQLQLQMSWILKVNRPLYYRLSFLQDISIYVSPENSGQVFNEGGNSQYPNEEDFYEFMQQLEKPFLWSDQPQRIFPIRDTNQMRAQNDSYMFKIDASVEQ